MCKIYEDVPIEDAEHFNFDIYTNALLKIISNDNNKTPFSIAINGKWGSGKTSLMKTLKKKLDVKSGDSGNRKVRTVWFDAWKYSETESMLAALIFEILEEIGRGGFKDKFKTKIRVLSEEKDILKQLTDLAKILTFGQGPEFEKWVKEPAFKEKLSFYDIFRVYMEKILMVDLMVDEGVLVIFIDDLDRCPPKKITKVLESINLFFDHEGCFFIIGTDISLISNAIEVEYKTLDGFSGSDYIKKMIQLQFDLPRINEIDIKEFIRDKLEITRLNEKYLDLIAKSLEQNPREIKRFINSLNFMRIIGESIKGLDYNEELLIKWNILNFSSIDFIKYVKNNHELLIKMQEISREEDKSKIEDYLKDDYFIKKSYDIFKHNKKIFDVLEIGDQMFNESNIPNYIFLSSVAPKEPKENIEVVINERFDRKYIIGPSAKLSGANLQKANLQNENLLNADFSRANLFEINLQGTDLQGANLQEANLQGSNLQETNLQGANLYKSYLFNANLSQSNLQEANLQKANLFKTNLQKANLFNANLDETNLVGAIFDEDCLISILQTSNWKNAKFDENTLSEIKSLKKKLDENII